MYFFAFLHAKIFVGIQLKNFSPRIKLLEVKDSRTVTDKKNFKMSGLHLLQFKAIQASRVF